MLLICALVAGKELEDARVSEKTEVKPIDYNRIVDMPHKAEVYCT